MNKFLKEQIEKHFGSAEILPLDMKDFIEDLNDTLSTEFTELEQFKDQAERTKKNLQVILDSMPFGVIIIDKIDSPKLLKRISRNASGKKVRKLAMEKLQALKPEQQNSVSDTPSETATEPVSDSSVESIEKMLTAVDNSVSSTDIEGISKIVVNAENLISLFSDNEVPPELSQTDKEECLQP